MAKITDLDDTQIMRIARLRVTESGAATFTEQSLDTQLSVERGVIWLIHWVEFRFRDVDELAQAAQGTSEKMSCQITKESKTSISTFSNNDVIQSYEQVLSRAATIGTDAGPLSFHVEQPRRFRYPIPLPFAAANIYVGYEATHTAATAVDVRIGYTIAQVSDKFFFRVAQALVS